LRGRVFSASAIVNIVNDFDDKFLFAKMTAETYKTYKLVVEKTPDSASSIYFEGFLLPQSFSQNISHRSLVALTFTNGLTMLQNVTPSFLTDARSNDYISEMDILINIFEYLDLDYTIYINTSLFEDTMDSAVGATNPMDYTLINRLVFLKNDGTWDDALTILNKVLNSINADCFIKG